MDREKKEFGAWWIWVLGLVALTVVVAGGLNVAGVFVERKVFEQSYQHSTARKAEVATYEAQLAELSSQLSRGVVNEEQIRSQMAAIRIRLAAAKDGAR